MRTAIAGLVLAGLTTAAPADDPKPPPAGKAGAGAEKVEAKAGKEKKGPSLKVGDKAPPLKADKWLQGGEVSEFAPGKVYVVEFWATWCGPCIVMMPHMADLQKEYRDQGLTVIGYSAHDANNTGEMVAAFVKKRGPKLGYTFAYAGDRDTYDAWMKAAGRNGIPCSFVVDRAGAVAYIGHPMYLGMILPKLMAGSWTKDDAAAVGKAEKEVNEVFRAIGAPDAAAGLEALAGFEAKYPGLGQVPYFVGPKLGLLLKAEKFDEARTMADAVIARAADREDPTALRSVSAALRSAPKDRKEFTALGVKAAELGVKVAGDKDALALLNLAEAYQAAGDAGKAKAAAGKAVAAAEDGSAALKRYVKTQAKKFDDEDKKDGDKKDGDGKKEKDGAGKK